MRLVTWFLWGRSNGAAFQVTAYVYNCLADMNSHLERTLLRLISWHNARSRLLNQVCLQKMGLFQVPLHNVSIGKWLVEFVLIWVPFQEQEAKENPYYLIAWPEAESFVSCNLPPPQLMKLKAQPQLASPYKPGKRDFLVGVGVGGGVKNPGSLEKDPGFLEVEPRNPGTPEFFEEELTIRLFAERWEWWQYLNQSSSSDQRGGLDPVAAHGMRFLQFRNSFLRQKDDVAILRSVFHHLSRLKKDMEACLDVSRVGVGRRRDLSESLWSVPFRMNFCVSSSHDHG